MSLCFSASITTIECRTARAISAWFAPPIVISVMRFETSPIFICFCLEVMGFIPGYAGYIALGSKSFSPLRAGEVLTFPLLLGMQRTESPSKSAPDKRSATLGWIPIASLTLVPMAFLAWGFLLLTVSSGISNRPPWG